MLQFDKRLNKGSSADECDPEEGSSRDSSICGATTYEELLEETISLHCGEVTYLNNGQTRTELTNFRRTGIRGERLESLYQALKGLPVSSVDAEWSFSTAGRLCNKIRSRKVLSAMTLLFYHFKRTIAGTLFFIKFQIKYNILIMNFLIENRQ